MSKRRKIDPIAGVERLRVLYATGLPTADIAAEFGLNAHYVRDIARGLTYPDSPGPITPNRPRVRRGPSEDKEAAEIRYRFASGETEAQLADQYDYKQNTISDIVRHRSRCPHAPKKKRHAAEPATEGAQ